MATVENWWCHKRNMKYETSKARQWEKNITTKCCKHVNTNHSHTHIHTKTHTHRCVISLSSSSRPLKDVLLAGAGLIHIHSRPFASNNFHMGQLGWHKPSPYTIIMINDHDEDPNWKNTANISYLEDAGMVLHRIVSGMILINGIEGCQVVSRGGVQRPRLGWPAGFINYYGGQSTINHHLCRVCGIPAPFLLEWGNALGLHLEQHYLASSIDTFPPLILMPLKLAEGWEWGRFGC